MKEGKAELQELKVLRVEFHTGRGLNEPPTSGSDFPELSLLLVSFSVTVSHEEMFSISIYSTNAFFFCCGEISYISGPVVLALAVNANNISSLCILEFQCTKGHWSPQVFIVIVSNVKRLTL